MRDNWATKEETGETLFRCAQCDHMDAEVMGIEMQWLKRIAYTEEDTIFMTSRKKADVAQVFMDVRCTHCGHVVTLTIGEGVPGGQVRMVKSEEK